jgi:sulfite reductase alpha subunit-like flavoprotein
LIKFRYEPGDVLVVRPKNLSEEVDEFIKMMDWEEIADNAFVLVPNDEGKLCKSKTIMVAFYILYLVIMYHHRSKSTCTLGFNTYIKKNV